MLTRPPAQKSLALALCGTLAAAAALTACAAPADGAGAEGGGGDDGVTVLASFYPLQFVAQQVGGDLVTVENLTPPAAEPHDLELSPTQVRAIGEADVVVYLSGFQPAVDEGVEARQPAHVVDAAGVVELEEHPGTVEDHAEEEQHEGEEEEEGHDDHGGLDPHFWLDPSRLSVVGQAVADALAEADPEHADEYAAGAASLGQNLEALDQEFADGLAACEGATLVTSHAAFGYLAERYSLQQVGISELDPEAEPSPARLREIGDIVREHGVTTLYSETLVSPKVTETLAGDLGVRTATLDPLEGIDTEAAAAGEDYISVMQGNLAALEEGLVCS